MSDWQPIDTAPKDGTEVILYGPSPDGPRVTAGFWLQPDPPVVGDCGGECRCPEYGDDVEPFWCMMHSAYFMSNDGGFCPPWDATHWQPMPEQPA